jgi:hypothetical protein
MRTGVGTELNSGINSLIYSFIWSDITDLVAVSMVQARLQALQSRLHDVNAIVKIKNPSLLLQLQKSPGRTAPGSSMRK